MNKVWFKLKKNKKKIQDKIENLKIKKLLLKM